MTDPVKHCKSCGEQLVRNRKSVGAPEFSRRVYCNRKCMAAGMVKANPKRSAIHARSSKFRGESCESCGEIESLHVHHSDKNPHNNDPSNLVTLCSSCHAKWHWANGKDAQRKRRPRQIGVHTEALQNLADEPNLGREE